jgi:hypothetical protein
LAFVSAEKPTAESSDEAAGAGSIDAKPTKLSALDFCLAKAHFLQKIPYHQCGIALR